MNLLKSFRLLSNRERIEDLEKQVRELSRRLDFAEFKLKNPPPYKLGDKYDKYNIVTGINATSKKINTHWGSIDTSEIQWSIELINTKTGEKQIIFK